MVGGGRASTMAPIIIEITCGELRVNHDDGLRNYDTLGTTVDISYKKKKYTETETTIGNLLFSSDHDYDTRDAAEKSRDIFINE